MAAEQCLHEVFREQVSRSPHRPAVSFRDQSLTYLELDELSDRCAAALHRHGVAPGSLIGVCVERSADLIVALLGVLKAGGAYVPIDTDWPSQRIAFIAKDAACQLIISDESTTSLIPGNAGVVRTLAALRADSDRVGPELISPSCRPADLAYVMYTSGSTGAPKGVQVTHHNVMRLFTCFADLQISAGDVWVMFHSYAFDFSVWEMWGALLHGGLLVVPERKTVRDPKEFHRLLRERCVTILNQTPSAYSHLMPYEQRDPTPSIRAVIFGGEALRPRVLVDWFAQESSKRPTFINMYGITEVTVHATACEVTPELAAESASIIGRPLADLSIYVLDEGLQPVPVGIPGELFIAGAGVARGYLGRPGLTAERFVPDPFTGHGQRMYRTGDLVRYVTDRQGNIEFLGRLDHQVKIRGYRVELGEIEAVLATTPWVRQAAVLAREDEPGQQRLTAYLTITTSQIPPGQASDLPAALRATARQHLPDYMIPATYIILPEMPLTTNGKLNRKQLPAPASFVNAGAVGADGSIHAIVAEVWQQVLRTSRPGLDDNFFDLGGDSFDLVAVALKLSERLGREIQVLELFRYTTVNALSAHLNSADGQVISDAEQSRMRRRASLAAARPERGGR